MMNDITTTLPQTKELSEIITEQSRAGGWVCPSCRYYKGKLICEKNYFICFIGAYMADCLGYEEERRKP